MTSNRREPLIRKHPAPGRHLFAGGVLVIAVAASVSARAQEPAVQSPATAPTPAECGIPGHHALLERMSAAFVLNCDQEKKLEPLLHDEESVSKPLLAFQAFSPEEKKAVMLQVKVAARRQILPLLTPEQQQKMDAEINTVSHGGEGLQGGGGKKGGGKKAGGSNGKKEEAAIDPFEAEESLSHAIEKYDALSETEKKELVLKVKQAALRPDAPPVTPEQAQMLKSEIEKMSS